MKPKYIKLEKLLSDSKLSAYRLSKATGIAASTFSDWKTGKSYPKTDKLIILSNYFMVPLEYFFDEEK